MADTGAFVALFNKQDPYHQKCCSIAKNLRDSLVTTVPVLTEAFHLLSDSQGSCALKQLIIKGGVTIWFLDDDTLILALQLMEKYKDCPMDFADASLVVAAQKLKCYKIFTVDRNDFSVYRIQVGHHYKSFEILG
ncbi:PIN domain-containing protein [Candidatus Marithioploca araucensis]|uniref:PIN domain-containing protein n=1 Tax=Candidatus Marithioploca araucensis TaxID=70273 RepID=A0ABT7VUR8_9GAMM|nr:PIN domain-containing protein [Candidatus Marithioploca araucensis]